MNEAHQVERGGARMMWTMPHLALVQHNLFVMAAGEAPSQLCCARDLPGAMLAAIY